MSYIGGEAIDKLAALGVGNMDRLDGMACEERVESRSQDEVIGVKRSLAIPGLLQHDTSSTMGNGESVPEV